MCFIGSCAGRRYYRLCDVWSHLLLSVRGTTFDTTVTLVLRPT